jgi:hypothetical protein
MQAAEANPYAHPYAHYSPSSSLEDDIADDTPLGSIPTCQQRSGISRARQGHLLQPVLVVDDHAAYSSECLLSCTRQESTPVCRSCRQAGGKRGPARRLRPPVR